MVLFYVFSEFGRGERIDSVDLRQFKHLISSPLRTSVAMDTSYSSWYQNGLSFECTQCGNCCSGPGTGYVWVSESEIAEIAKAVGMEDDLDGFERKFTRRIGARVSLVEYSDGDCIFLEPETRRCSVYESRPSQCRTWPFWESNIATPKDWKEISKNCPGCNRGRLYSIEEIRAVIDGEKQAEKAFDGPDCGA